MENNILEQQGGSSAKKPNEMMEKEGDGSQDEDKDDSWDVSVDKDRTFPKKSITRPASPISLSDLNRTIISNGSEAT